MQKAAFGDSIGAMTIAGGIAAGLLQKERTGEGPVVDISLLGTAMWVLGPDIVSSKLLEGAGSGAGIPSFTRKSMFNPLVNPYQTKDGRWLLLNMLQADLFWAEVCTHLGREDLIDDERFADGRRPLREPGGVHRHPRRGVRQVHPRGVEGEAGHHGRASGPRCSPRSSSTTTRRPSPTATSRS